MPRQLAREKGDESEIVKSISLIARVRGLFWLNAFACELFFKCAQKRSLLSHKERLFFLIHFSCAQKKRRECFRNVTCLSLSKMKTK